jgi:hypothetical protein
MMNPLRELRAYLQAFRARCIRARWLAALFHLDVVSDIEKEVEQNEHKQAAMAHRAEVLDLEAGKALECGDINTAKRLLKRSAEIDHDITEALS